MTVPGHHVIDLEALERNPALEIARLCAFDPEDLQTAMVRQPVLFGYASVCYVQARRREADAKGAYERALALAFRRQRGEGAAIGTANEMKVVDEDVQRARDAMVAAEAEARMFHALVKGLEHRKDMIVQVAARQREEMRNLGG